MHTNTMSDAVDYEQFIDGYRAELIKTYPWARDQEKLAKFMLSVRMTCESNAKSWLHTGECVTTAWKAHGGKGVPSLKALRACAANRRTK